MGKLKFDCMQSSPSLDENALPLIISSLLTFCIVVLYPFDSEIQNWCVLSLMIDLLPPMFCELFCSSANSSIS